MTSQMTVGKKFSLACAALVMFTVMLGGVSINRLANIHANVEAIIVDSLPGVISVAEVRGRIFQIRGHAWKHMAASDTAQMGKVEDEIALLKQQVTESLARYDKTITLAEDRVMFDRLRPQIDNFYRLLEHSLRLSRTDKKREAVERYLA